MASVTDYVANARAVLDSLNHYEFLKIRTAQLRSDLQESQTEKLGLKIQVVRFKVSADSSRRAAAHLPVKLKAARTENWVWRGVAVLVALKTTVQLIGLFK